MHHLFHTLLRKLFILVGHDIFRDREFKRYLLTYMMNALLVLFFIGAVKTIAFYDVNTVLTTIGFVGIGLEVISNIISYI